MKGKERVRYEMFLRVRDFGTRHQQQFPESSEGEQVFRSVSEAIARIEAHTLAKTLAAKEGRKTKAAARAAVRSQMTAIVRSAKEVARRTPGIENKFQMPARDSDVALLERARLFLSEAVSVEKELTRLGLSSSWLSTFKTAVDAFDTAMQGRRVGRSTVAASQAGITESIAECFGFVRTLDVIVANAFGDDAVVLAAWKRDRRVMDIRADEPKPVDVPTAQTPTVIAKAS